jgi:hypothetical protein
MNLRRLMSPIHRKLVEGDNIDSLAPFHFLISVKHKFER